MGRSKTVMRAGYAIGIAALLGVRSGLALAQGMQAQCWQPSELQGRQGEKSIARVPYDPSIEPAGVNGTASTATVGSAFRGSIRRVDLPANEKLIALTFDLCENANEISGYDGEIFDVLRERDVKATFFASGKWLLDHRQRGEQVLADPLFEVGAHSWVHRNFRLLPAADIDIDLGLSLRADASVREGLRGKRCQTGAGVRPPASPVSLFRFPFGTCNADSLRAVNDAGLIAIQWDVVSADPAPQQTAEAIRKEIAKSAKSGSIVVMHANGRGWHTSEALPLVIDDLRARGFGFATVSELLAKGRPVAAESCYEIKPGDNVRYDKLFPANGPVIGARQAAAPEPQAP